MEFLKYGVGGMGQDDGCMVRNILLDMYFRLIWRQTEKNQQENNQVYFLLVGQGA